MKSEESRKQFRFRLWRWALQEWEVELKNDFPLLGSVSGNSAVKAVALLRGLDATPRTQLARAMVKRFHKEACAESGDPLTDADLQLLKWADGMRVGSGDHRPPTTPDQLLRHAVIDRMKVELDFLGRPTSDGTPQEWHYRNVRDGWSVVTHVEAVGRFGDCSYAHAIETPGGIQIARFLSLLSWLGVSSNSRWRVKDHRTADQAAVAIASLCRHFLDAVPSLVGGLVVDS